MPNAQAERVLVLGGGPVGMIAALLLARQGIASTVIERRNAPPRSPQAHVIKQRSMEILRDLGIASEVLAQGTPPEEMRYINWVYRLNGPLVAQLDIWESPEVLSQIAEASPVMPGNLAQNLFEEILHEHVRRTPLIDLRLNCRATGVEQSPAGVALSVEATGADGAAREVLTAPYLVACDGANSAMRDWLDIGMEGPEKLATVVMIHFEADLSRYMADRPGVLFWNLDPDNPGNFIVHDMRRTHVYMHPYDDAREGPGAFTVERAKEIVRRAIGEEGADIEIVSVRPWVMRSQVAAAYRKGRIFLAGDAAHRFPPTGGLGMNTGIAEACNLAWKLAAVMNGWGGEALLDSYETECRPVAVANAAHSLNNSAKMFEVLAAAGLTGNREADTAALARFGAHQISDPEREGIADAVRAQREHFLTVGLDLGGRYASPVIADDAATQRESTALDFVPTTRPGSRLPHIWLDAEGKCSTHDLVSAGAFTLLAATLEPGGAEALRCAASVASIPLEIVELGEGFARIPDTAGFEALLLRPDHHIAWRGRQHDLEHGAKSILHQSAGLSGGERKLESTT